MTDCKFQNLFQFKSQIHKSSSFMNVTGNGKYTTNLNKHTISIDVYLFVCGCVWNWCADWVYWPRTISMDVYLFVCDCVWNWCADWVYWPRTISMDVYLFVCGCVFEIDVQIQIGLWILIDYLISDTSSQCHFSREIGSGEVFDLTWSG